MAVPSFLSSHPTTDERLARLLGILNADTHTRAPRP
jgi:hypothetical protein